MTHINKDGTIPAITEKTRFGAVTARSVKHGLTPDMVECRALYMEFSRFVRDGNIEDAKAVSAKIKVLEARINGSIGQGAEEVVVA